MNNKTNWILCWILNYNAKSDALSTLYTSTNIEMVLLTAASKGKKHKICSNSHFSKLLKTDQRKNNKTDY
jgi:hypothetical protein